MHKIKNQLVEASKANNSHLQAIIEPMKDKFNKYWHSMQQLSAIGLILDPRYKIQYLKFSLQETRTNEDASKFVEEVRKSILALWDMYTPPTASSELPAANNKSTSKTVDADTERFLQYMSGSVDTNQTNVPSAELNMYLEERIIGITHSESFDLLTWWKMNETWFPSLSKLAKIVLMAPASSVASESAFSTGGCVLDYYWSCLNEATVKALVCAQDWMRSWFFFQSSLSVLYLLVIYDIYEYEYVHRLKTHLFVHVAR